MNNVFDMVPGGFFNPLSSGSNNVANAACLIEIYDQYDKEVSYRISRKVLRDNLAIYILENHLKSDDETENDDSKPIDIANNFIRKFISPDVGWLIEETDDSTYEKYIVMTEAGIALAEFLKNIEKPEKVEYSTYIYSIFNTLQRKEQWIDDPYVNAIKPVFQNAKALSKSLKRLSTFIRKKIEEMLKEVSLETLTENLLAYCNGDFIKEYARLTKQQNIHIYRNQIKHMLDQMTSNQEEFETIVLGCAIEESLEESEAENYVYEMLDATRRFLSEDYDRIMSDIKHKINMHMHIAVGRIRFIRNNGKDSRGSVEQFIKILRDAMSEIEMKDELPEEMRNLFRLDRNEYIDLASVRYPRKNKSIRKVTTSEVELLSEEDILAAKMQQKQEAYNPYSKDKMKQYMQELIAHKQELHADEIPMGNKDELLAAISAVTYGEENGYDISVEDGYIESNGLLIRRFNVKKK
jgi:hypothetical protein